MNKLTHFFRQYRGLVENFSYLSAVQIVNLGVSLFSVIYLIRVLGQHLYGLVVFAQSTIFFLVVLVSYGFLVTATKEVSLHRKDPDKLNEIFSSVMIIKGLLFILSCGIIVVLTYIIPKARPEKLLFYLTMMLVFYEFIYPYWFFQGIEKMGYSTLATVVVKMTFFALIFIFIKKPEDYYLVPLFNGIGSLISGVICLYIVFVKEKIKFSFQPVSTIKFYLKDSTAIFVSNSASQIYSNTNKFLIGNIFSNSMVALYDVAEKIVLAMKMPHSVLNQAIFPKISKEKNRKFAEQLFYYTGFGELILYFVVFLAAPVIVVLIGGKQAGEAVNILRLLAITVPLNALSSYLGIQFLIVNDFKKLYSRLVLLSVGVYVIAGFGLHLTGLLTVKTLIYAAIATEVFAFCIMVYQVYSKKLAWVR